MSDKNQGRLLLLIGIPLLALLGYFIFLKVKDSYQKNVLGNNQPKSDDPPCDTSTNNHVSTYPLQKGSTGVGVKRLQAFLNQEFGERLCVDGVWGNMTEKAVQKYPNEVVLLTTKL